MGFGFDAPFDLNAFEKTYSDLRNKRDRLADPSALQGVRASSEIDRRLLAEAQAGRLRSLDELGRSTPLAHRGLQPQALAEQFRHPRRGRTLLDDRIVQLSVRVRRPGLVGQQ